MGVLVKSEIDAVRRRLSDGICAKYILITLLINPLIVVHSPLSHGSLWISEETMIVTFFPLDVNIRLCTFARSVYIGL